MHHQLVAVPPASLRQKINHRFEVRVLARKRQPRAAVAYHTFKGHDGSVGIPVVTERRTLLLPVNIKVRESGSALAGSRASFDIVLQQEEEKSRAVCLRLYPRPRVLRRQSQAVVVGGIH